MNTNILFQAAHMGNLEVSNRIFMAPMTRSRAVNEEHAPMEFHAEYYRQRASAGLIISEGTVVSPGGVGYMNVPGIYTLAQVAAWKNVTDAVHNAGGKIFVQIWHVGRQSHPDFLQGELPVAPSAINPEIVVHTPTGKHKSLTPHELTLEEIDDIIDDFKRAGEHAMEAGFDGVEIHASNAYLFHQFFSNSSNCRTDIYGGSDENKARILFDVIDALEEIMPANAIGVRLNPMLHGMGGIKVDDETAGTFEYIIKGLNTYSLAYLHLTRPSSALDEDYYIKDVIGHFGGMYDGFVLANGNYDAEAAAHEIEIGRADAVAFGRPYIANPDLPERIRKGWPLASPDSSTFYSGGREGYTDYPLYNI